MATLRGKLYELEEASRLGFRLARLRRFGTIVGDTQVSEDVVWAKLEAMRDGAAIDAARQGRYRLQGFAQRRPANRAKSVSVE